MTPPVSVLVTTFNQAAYIEEAIASVLDQTLPPSEIIVIDDGSTDDTPERLASFGDRIHAVRQPNQGVAGSRNTAVRLARGDLLAFLDGDDVWERDKLAHQVAAARQHPHAGMVVVDGVQFDGQAVVIESLFGPRVRRMVGAAD